MTDSTGARAPGWNWANADLDDIPVHLLGGLVRYVDDGIPTGAALRSLLENGNVLEVVPKLDVVTFQAMPKILKFFYSNLPHQSWGSPEKVAAWIKAGGVRGGGCKS